MRTHGRVGGNSGPLARGLVAALVLGATLSCYPVVAAAGPEPTRLVVVLYPNESDGAPGTFLADRGIRSTFASDAPGRVEVRNEYVDTSRLRDADFKQAQVELLRRKYAGRKVDLVIAGLSSALDFALEHRGELFPDVPIVYCSVDQREVQARTLPPDIIGVPIRMDLAATLDLALKLHPDTRHVFVVAGRAPFDVFWEAEARRTFRPYEGRLEFVFLTGLSMDDLLGRVANLPERSIVYYLNIFQDGTGVTFVPADALERLAGRANAPIYSHVGSYLGRGIVGGRVFSFETEGKHAARLGLRILAGEKPESIPVPEVSPNADQFDGRQFRRWGISDQSLPPGSTVLYKEPSFWEAYKWYVIGVLSLCAVESLLIAGLLAQWVKRKRADRRFRQVIEAAPTGILMVGRDGKIVLVNSQAERLFGYEKEELLGQPVELLVPERARSGHATDRARYFTAPEVRPVGAGRDLFGRRQDGSEFPVEIGLSPVQTSEGMLVLASIIDLSERKRAEEALRVSYRRQQTLARQLLTAQEGERRRIARELHDDLNQQLALLAVELDVLGEKPPGTPAQVAERVRELSALVKELSSTVHDLSHQLHPSKLEQLGLVAAVRGLCRELTESHGLEARFTHDLMPDVIPNDIALCLYRIVQEALHNIIKHSGTRHATVELSGTADAVCLRIVDNGVGFDPDAEDGNGGLGLVSMRERLHLVRGEIAIDSRPSGGTRIDIRVPVSEASLEGALQAGPAAG
jgi:PAS domain S-box-containing protein